MGESSPTARALVTLGLLQAEPGVTASRLADALGVSERAARRYVAILRESGIPVDALRGPYGGYRVGRGVRPPPVTFTAAEALGLVMAVLDGHHHTSDPEDAVSGAVNKLLRSLPEAVARAAGVIQRNVAPAPDRAAARPDPALTTDVVQACSDRRRVRLRYRSESGRVSIVEVDPWAIVVRHGRWYVLCWSHRAQARRAYRIDRIEQVDLLAARFEPPDDLDPVAELEAHLAVGWEYDVEVVIDAPLRRAARCISPAIGQLAAVDDDTTRLTGTTSNPHWLVEQLVRVPASYRIVGGPEIRAAAETLGRRLLAAGTSDG
jgi:predicted DNA-binding transcriptional regulator YafY